MAQVSIAAVRSAAPSRSVRILVAGLLAALVTLLASGCVGGSPSAVAYVGDSRINQSQLDAALTGVQSTLEAGQQVSSAAVVNAMIHGTIAREIAAKNNITVTDAERDKLVKPSNLASLLTNPDAKSVAYDLADTQIVSEALGADAYLADLQTINVELNPRFGVLDPANKTIVDGQSSSLSLAASTS